MILASVFVRFYKSFNFDYLRKFNPNVIPRPWENVGETSLWYPHVCVKLDSQVTTIVGANESGKSQLLSAIRKGISGEGIQRSDFCRYSQFFAVEREKMRWPDFGFEWTNLNAEDQKLLDMAVDLPFAKHLVERFIVFRKNVNEFIVFVPEADSYKNCPVKDNATVQKMFPNVFSIDARIALPENVPIRFLANGVSPTNLDLMGRKNRFQLNSSIHAHATTLSDATAIPQAAAAIASSFSGAFAQKTAEQSSDYRAQVELARTLICDIANVDTEALKELHDALRDEKDAYVNGIVQKINNALSTSLNFPKWWVQDKDFNLRVSPREFDLVFTVVDRTGTEYAFNERSSGLKYFLSYFIQYLAYKPKGRQPEILLMDEPDQFLSSQGQQDLLKLFEQFSMPDGGRAPVQVVYVTHSPFLIDKNHSERIRVLEKGVSDEGTRVVKDVAKNHYEPLRSAFGAFVGETAFIGNCNIVVEGPSDQIFLAGAASFLRFQGTNSRSNLDLNHATICIGSA